MENHSDIWFDEIVLGDYIDVSARGYGGGHSYQYAILYKKKTEKKWTVAQDYSDNNSVCIRPAKATDYDICVKVKDSNGDIAKKYFTVKVNPKLKNTSVISAATIRKGSTVTVTGSATGGMGNYQYSVLYKKKSESKWTLKQDYQENAKVVIKPCKNTDYDVCIKVKDNNDTVSKKYFSVAVK